MTYNNKNKTLQTTLYRKLTDQESYLHAHSDHPQSHKKKAYRIVVYFITEFKKHCAIQKFIETRYEKNILKDQIHHVDNTEKSNKD